ncbi:cytidylyltransferase domain-containing protein, partial [Pseudomonas aeruginosa]|uniref:cytidylyltransferase domain-containing protein n=1 Tax=Pseudomonas aeruginosa TaxID=287 RepID=UPI0031B7CD09
DVARSVREISKIFVSTDCKAIADVAQQYGAEVIWRPEELATDNSPEWLAWQHAIKTLRDRGDQFDLFVSLPALKGALTRIRHPQPCSRRSAP